MAGIPKEHNELYFDKLCRTQKSETVLSLIQATYHAKRNLTSGENVREAIAKRLVSAYELFKDNPKGTNSGAGTYSGDYKQFESQYTIGHELCIWKNSNLDLTDLAISVARNKITIKDYFDVFFLNYFQPIDGKGVHILYSILEYMIQNSVKYILKKNIPSALGVTCSNEMINALCNFLDGTNYLDYTDDKLCYVGNEPIDSFIKRCNIKYIGKEGLTLAKSELDTDEKYAAYITSGSLKENSNINLPDKDMIDLILKHWNAKDFNYVDIDPILENFNKEFGKEAIAQFDDDECLYKIFGKKQNNSLVYQIEFSEELSYFGGISNYRVHYVLYEKDGIWKYAKNAKNIQDMTYEEAKKKAVEFRNQFVSFFDLIDNLINNSALNSLDGYTQLYQYAKTNLKAFVNKNWFWKYVYLLYPDYFMTFYSNEWVNIIFRVAKIIPGNNYIVQCGQFTNLARIIGIKPVYLYYILILIDDLDEIIEDDDGMKEIVSSNIASKYDKMPRIKGGRNIILYGVPGAGKSYTIQQEYCNDEDKMERLVFHPDYTYSDFVGQILPSINEDRENKSIQYKFEPGPFTTLLKKAYRDPENRYYLIIEEINRGNAPAIFGDIFQLLDRNTEGTSMYGITNKDIAKIVYDDTNHKVKIPSNMSILCTMNTSDQNVFTLDTAFQRRWNMRLIENTFKKDDKLADVKILDTSVTWRVFQETINEIILNTNIRLTSAEDKRLGTHFVVEEDLVYNGKADNGSGQEKIDAILENRRFAEKVIKYLWDDAFKFNRESLFKTRDNGTNNSLEAIIKAFLEAKGDARFDIFLDNVKKTMIDESAPKIQAVGDADGTNGTN